MPITAASQTKAALTQMDSGGADTTSCKSANHYANCSQDGASNLSNASSYSNGCKSLGGGRAEDKIPRHKPLLPSREGSGNDTCLSVALKARQELISLDRSATLQASSHDQPQATQSVSLKPTVTSSYIGSYAIPKSRDVDDVQHARFYTNMYEDISLSDGVDDDDESEGDTSSADETDGEDMSE